MSARPTAVALIEQAAREVDALRFRLWSEVEVDDPSLRFGGALESALKNLDRVAEDLRFAATGEYPPRSSEGEAT